MPGANNLDASLSRTLNACSHSADVFELNNNSPFIGLPEVLQPSCLLSQQGLLMTAVAGECRVFRGNWRTLRVFLTHTSRRSCLPKVPKAVKTAHSTQSAFAGTKIGIKSQRSIGKVLSVLHVNQCWCGSLVCESCYETLWRRQQNRLQLEINIWQHLLRQVAGKLCVMLTISKQEL